jgi:hypothetical protein
MNLELFGGNMEKFYVSLRPFMDDSKNGFPAYIHMIYTEKINTSKPMQPIYTNNWLYYNLKRNGTPVPDEYKLPKQLFLICKSIKDIKFDFYTQEAGEWIVSEDFYNFIIKQNCFIDLYETSELTIQTTKGKRIGFKKYYLMRFIGNNDNLVNWEESSQIDANVNTGIRYKFYSELNFYDKVNIPQILYFSKIAFKESFVVNENIKDLMMKNNFLGFDFYTLNEFIEEKQKRIDYFKKNNGVRRHCT